jgi:hypothetical protein
MANAIGDFAFIRLGPMPEVYRRMLLVLDRPGVNNHVILRTGMKGRPFTVRTGVDAIDLYDGVLATVNYQSIIGTDAVELVYNDVAMSDFRCKFLVLDVKPLEVRALQGAIGGLFPPSRAWVTAEWTLLPIGF